MAEHRLGVVLRLARSAFSKAEIETADLDARLLVEHYSGTTRTDAITNPDRELSPDVVEKIEQAIARRLAGEPVHRILGFREFYGLTLELSPETLEPRPDTETLVDAVRAAVRQAVEKKGYCRILDLGTGTGAIALALLHQVPEAEAVGVDISPGALETARRNARKLGLEDRFFAHLGSWFEAIGGSFDVIVSNPPYIKKTDLKNLDRDVRDFDPVGALDGGEDGLECYRAIAIGAGGHLSPGGVVAVEIGFDQAKEVEEIFAKNGFFLAQKYEDLGKRDRVLAFLRADYQVLRP